jgi:DNA-directed RNA polymerase specialized sigma24 family protein
VVARVSKRIYRSTRQSKQPLPIDVEAKSENSSMQIKLDIDEFLKTLSASDSILFSLRYLDDEPVSSICQKIGMEKSVIYERLDKLRNRFKNFYP